VKIKVVYVLLCVFATLLFSGKLHAQGTAFTYQGQLYNSNNPASGNYDLTFALYNSANLPGAVAGPITNSAVIVTNGLFTTILDFGPGIFTGTNYWLEIAVRATGTTNFTTLSPRQPLTPTPYAIFANTASNLLGSLSATQLSGALPSAQISGTYSSAVTFSNNANSFSGNGSNLTSLNASQLTSGTVADTRLSTNVALLNGTQTFSGANAFTNFGNSFRGSFFGNGLVGWIVTNGTAVQAVLDTGYLFTNSQLVTVTLPTSVNAGDIVRISGAGAGGWQIAQNANQSVLGNFSSLAKSSWTLSSASNPQNWDSIASSSDSSKLIAAVYGGGIYFSANSGATWTETNSSATTWYSVACSSDGSKLYAVRFDSGVYTNSAIGWGLGGPAGSLNCYAVACSSDGTKVVTVVSNSSSGGIYTSSNSGVTWATTGAAARNWVSVASSADGTKLVAVVYGGAIYTSANWSTARTSGSKNWVSVASSADGTKLAAAAAGGVIYTSSDSGSTWVTNNVPTANWQSIASSADGSKLVAVISGGGIYASSNYGATWTQTSGSSNNWQSIASSSDGGKLAAAVYGGGIYTAQASSQVTTTTVGTTGYITGGQGAAVELQYIGNNQFMPVSSAGTIWAY
jgi:hypothetical protein